nr:hypothetical protein [Tanacetum cinerariifolium]
EYCTGRVYLRHRRIIAVHLNDVALGRENMYKHDKAQSQACEQSMVEAEKDFKKMIGHMSEPHETMEASYMDVLAEPQARATGCTKGTAAIFLTSIANFRYELSTINKQNFYHRIIAVHLNDVVLGRENMYKRDKAQSQACEQSMVEAEKDFKKMIGHMSEPHETMEASFALMSVLKAFRSMDDQEGPWPRLVSTIAHRCGAA